MKCKLVDVFAQSKFSGNGLTIFYDLNEVEMTTARILQLTKEMRQFESIFLFETAAGLRARIFTMEEELDFAGHPLLGLAAHLHEEKGTATQHDWTIQLNQKSVRLSTQQIADHYQVTMDQGKPNFLRTVSSAEAQTILDAFQIPPEYLSAYPLEVVSTGLDYLLIPLQQGLEQIKANNINIEPLLQHLGAKFAYLFDVNTFEGRTWDNEGKVEDIATGSAAGPVGAYLVKHQLAPANQAFSLKQGRLLGRPSELGLYVEAQGSDIRRCLVSGAVYKIADIHFAL